tara:strand:- start:208 stop:522 length:315 start_codon:yes stop_codon:yes gene_type:complete
MEESKTTPKLIFLTYIPRRDIKINEVYTKGMVPCNPKNKSETNRLIMGIKNTIQRLLKPLLDNKAIAVMGVKLGGWGKNLDKIAIKMSETTKTFLLIILQKSSY